MDRKHLKKLKRKKILVSKRRAEEERKKRMNSTAVRAEQHYRAICQMLKKVGKETEEYKELNKMKVAYEKLQEQKKLIGKKEKPKKQLPTYRVVKLTAKLDKVESEIKQCSDEKLLEKLKNKKKTLKAKLNLK